MRIISCEKLRAEGVRQFGDFTIIMDQQNC
jgi:hypothetical protein